VAIRFAMMVEKAAAGRGRGRRSGKVRVVDQTAGMAEWASTPLSICLSDRQGRDEAVAQEGAQNSVKKVVYFGTHRSRVSVHASHEALTLHSSVAHPGSPWLTLLARCEVLKRHGGVRVKVSSGRILVLLSCHDYTFLHRAHPAPGLG
jgi:hypothetical protein